jgi:hypothetical protein
MKNKLIDVLQSSFSSTFMDLLPIVFVLALFQIIGIRKRIPQLKKISVGFVLVFVGLAIFIAGLEECIFPVGTEMANQLTSLEFIGIDDQTLLEVKESGGSMDPSLYIWTYTFAFLIGFSTTMAEPSLIAVAIKAKEISSGAISQLGLRLAVAIGVAIGVSLGTYRIIDGTPLYIFIATGYGFLLILTCFAPKMIIPLAYDSGGVTTSTVTVPLLTALGIGMATNVPNRSALLDGFGLIAFASLFPIISVMAYAMITAWIAKRRAEH